jgi:hypothetical protein
MIKIEVSERRRTKFKMKFKLNNYLTDGGNENLFGYSVIENFYDNSYSLISPSFDDYFNGNRPLKRKIVIFFSLSNALNCYYKVRNTGYF